MRVIKKDGQYAIDNEPMRLLGKAARNFLAKLESGKTSNPRHAQVLAEIQAEVRKAKSS
jgi:hypothetical protein